MLNKAVDWKNIKDTPRIKLLKVQNQPVKFLTVDEVDRLIDAATIWLKPKLLVLRNTGMRQHELFNLRFKDIDFNNKTIVVTSNKTNNFRVIPMNQELYQTLLWLNDNYVDPKTLEILPRQDCQKEYIFCMPNGDKLASIKHSFYNACKKAGIKASPHMLRHSFASHRVMNGMDIVSIKELLGHSQISTTMIYSHLSPNYKANTV